MKRTTRLYQSVILNANWNQYLLQRSDERSAATDTMAKKGSGDRRASSLGAAVVFQQCPGSRLVEPNMP